MLSLNDTHFGCRNDSPHFMEYQNRFYDELFFPYIQENNIRHLIHLGDVVDRRNLLTTISHITFKRSFWKRLYDMRIDTHIM